MTADYELFDHTADVGVRVRGSSLAELVPAATRGLYAVIGTMATLDAPAPWTFEARDDDPSLMLRDYLAEVLRLFDAEQRCVTDMRVEEFTPKRLIVSAHLRPLDANGSALEREVKAVTYHELGIRTTGSGYEATFILDI
jgi:SHS2 domain-containing protein